MLEDIAAQAVRQSPCQCYDSDRDDAHPAVTVEAVVTRHWRGWAVTCDRCGELMVEYDEPEDPAEHRSVE